jgi:GT2 family glycosyltransferase/glycosyltransferase involved in cell wall biosynthesis
MKIFYYPDFNDNNPYQSLLYAESEKNLASVVAGEIETAIDFKELNPSENVVFHLHWQNVITGPALNAHDFKVRAKCFLDKLAIFRSLGGRVVWTIHNKLPHDAKFISEERDFHTKLADLVDKILLHDEISLNIVLSEYFLDSKKVEFVKHGNYIGAYPDEVGRDQARQCLGIPEHDFVFGFVGQLRPYKGLNEFVEACYELTGRKTMSALIAGKPVWPLSKGKVTKLCSPISNVRVYERYIPDVELQLYLRSLDVLVLPYKEILTSGSVMLAASFGIPVVVPDIESFSSIKNMEFIHVYDPQEAGGLSRVIDNLSKVDKSVLANQSEAATKYALLHDWESLGKNLYLIFQRLFEAADLYLPVRNDDRFSLSCLGGVTYDDFSGCVAVCVVNYYSCEDVFNLVNSIRRNTKSGYQIFILDNSCNRQESIRLKMQLENVFFVESSENVGYAAGNNYLVELAMGLGCEKFAILNPDVEIYEDVLDVMGRRMNENKLSVYSPIILNSDHKISFFTADIKCSSQTLEISHMGVGLPKEVHPDGLYDSDVLNGCALFFHKDLVKKYGYIPEDYFLYFEETDWTYSIKRSGGQLSVDTSVAVIHNKKSQGGGLPTVPYVYYLLRNSIIFASRFGFDTKATEERYRSSFVVPWIERIEKRAPDYLMFFKDLCELAFRDGNDGVTGKVDIIPRLHHNYGRGKGGAGFIDSYDGVHLCGWAVSGSSKDAEVAKVLFFINGKFHSSATCKQLRSDIGNIGLQKESGFSIEVASDCMKDDFEIVEVENYISLGKTELLKLDVDRECSPIKFSEPKESVFKSNIEGYQSGKINGWVVDLANDMPVEIEILLDGFSLGQVEASLYRADLDRAGFAGGRCHFSLYVDPAFLNRELAKFEIRLPGSDYVLCSKEVKVRSEFAGVDFDMGMKDYLSWSYINVISPYGWYEFAERLQSEIKFLKNRFISKAQRLSSVPDVFISVVMPVYNRESVVETALDSILAQSYKNYEVIIVDDGSDDATCQVVENYIAENNISEKFVLVRLGTNSGVSSARNAGLDVAKGEVIAYLDSDNEWDSEYLNLVGFTYKDNPGSDCAYAGQEVWLNDKNKGIKFRTNLRMVPFNRSLLENGNYIDLNIFSHKRSMVERKGGFREDIYRLVDWDLILRYTEDKPPVFLPLPLNHYYFGFADNQITKTESYEKNLKKLFEGMC